MIDQLKDFVADGNTLIGPPPKCVGQVKLVWTGGENHLTFGKNITLAKGQIKFLNKGGRISIGSDTQIKGDLVVNKGSTITIGKNTFFNRVCDVRAQEGADIHIGDNCLFSNVGVFTSDLHSIVDLKTGKRSNPAQGIVVEDNVWIAEDVKITKGGRVGTGAIIAAGSIVTRPIAPYCIGAGRPAKVVRTGVSWNRNLLVSAPQKARDFTGEDIPLDREVLRRLVADKRYALVLSAINAEIVAGTQIQGLPLFVKWYFVFCRNRLNQGETIDKQILEGIISERPDHKAAQKLYNEHFS